MDQDRAPDPKRVVGFTIDFVSMSIVYEGGFSVPIVAMYDRFDMETDDPEEAEELLVEMPPDGIVVTMVMDDILDSQALIPDFTH
ncbi:hypothetical protein I6F34_01035 [Bradyrhizobium sp. BRP05]|nr:hypothetical protein [Bradyrhizobium sp. BRP05]